MELKTEINAVAINTLSHKVQHCDQSIFHEYLSSQYLSLWTFLIPRNTYTIGFRSRLSLRRSVTTAVKRRISKRYCFKINRQFVLVAKQDKSDSWLGLWVQVWGGSGVPTPLTEFLATTAYLHAWFMSVSSHKNSFGEKLKPESCPD